MGLGLNIGLRGLLTSQAALETIGHNVSNANTPGYSRQSLALGTTEALRTNSNVLLGTGVRAEGVSRTVDELLNRRLLQQVSSLGRLNTRATSLTQVEAVLGSGSSDGVSGLLRDFFSSVSALSTAPEDLVLRTGLVQSSLQMTGQLNAIGSNLKTEREGAEQQLRSLVGGVNDLAQQLFALNRDIVSSEAGGSSANDLRDRRDRVLGELSDLVDVQSFENEVGAIRVLASGGLLVHPSGYNQMEVVESAEGALSIRLQDSNASLSHVSGRIGGLLHQLNEYLPELQDELDLFTKNLVLEVNRHHSTGVPASGPIQLATSTNRLSDPDQDGILTDQLLSESGLPFELSAGALRVNVSSELTGEVESSVIEIDPARMTVADLVNALSAIDNLTAGVDGQGRISLVAADDHGFEFSQRLDPNPNSAGTFGGQAASLGSAIEGPFALQVGQTLQVQGPFGTANVTLAASDFQQISAATAEELATAINADPSLQTSGLLATSVGDQLFLQTQAGGPTASLTVNGGSALAALGFNVGDSATGHQQAVQVTVGGEYSGKSNNVYRFRPTSDGIIGTTPGLKVEVRDNQEQVIAVLDVGAGYVPGQELAVADGVTISFGYGTVSATSNERFDLDVTADSDTSDVLVALGLNSFFTGSTLLDIDVRSDLERDPGLIATSSNGSPGDGGALLSLLGLQQDGLAQLAGQSLPEKLAGLVSATGLELSSTNNVREAEQFLLDGLNSRRDELVGVNVDEELVNLIEFEQAFQAASQFIRVMSEIGDELLALI